MTGDAIITDAYPAGWLEARKDELADIMRRVVEHPALALPHVPLDAVLLQAQTEIQQAMDRGACQAYQAMGERWTVIT